MQVDVTVERGVNSYKYRMYICESPRDGVIEVDLGVRVIDYSHAVVYFLPNYERDVILVPSESLAMKLCEKLKYEGKSPIPVRIYTEQI
jgi:hypothetical protein